MRALALVGLFALAACDRLIDRRIEQAVLRPDRTLLADPGLHVVLCGTGSPLADAARAGACTAVVAGGAVYLVDVGPGSWETLDLAGVPTEAVTTVLLTHFHSDHIGDLGETITQGWIAGRAAPLDVYGPPGTAGVVDGFVRAYRNDVAARVAHHGERNMPRAAAGAVAHEVPVPDGDRATEVLERGGLRVTTFRVNHQPVEPAVGYRFEYAGRVVVVSGDTKKSVTVARHAMGADILVHEALNRALIERAIAVMRRHDRSRLAEMATDIFDYHTSPVEAAEIARDAGVGHLVLTHLVPGPPNALARRLFAAGVAETFPGEVTLGEDGMRFALAPKG